jgi:hypothetical protein
MPTFRAFVLALHIPTSEVLNYGKDFDKVEDAVAQPYWLLDRLHKDLGERFRCHSWEHPRAHEHFFIGAFFEIGGADGIVGMVMVMALEEGGDGTSS